MQQVHTPCLELIGHGAVEITIQEKERHATSCRSRKEKIWGLEKE